MSDAIGGLGADWAMSAMRFRTLASRSLPKGRGGYQVAAVDELRDELLAFTDEWGAQTETAVMRSREEIRTLKAQLSDAAETGAELANRLERVEKELVVARRQVGALETQAAELLGRPDPFEAAGDQIATVLRCANEVANAQRTEAETAAEQLRADAEATATQLWADAAAAAAQLRAETETAVTQLRTEAEARATRTLQEADDRLGRAIEAASNSRREADEYAENVRRSADEYALDLRAAVDDEADRIRETAAADAAQTRDAASLEAQRLLGTASAEARQVRLGAVEEAHQIRGEAERLAEVTLEEATRLEQDAHARSKALLESAEHQAADMIASATANVERLQAIEAQLRTGLETAAQWLISSAQLPLDRTAPPSLPGAQAQLSLSDVERAVEEERARDDERLDIGSTAF